MQAFLQRGSAEFLDPVQIAGAELCGFLHSCMRTAIYLTWHSSFYSHRKILFLSRVQHSPGPLLSFAAFLSACSRLRSGNVRRWRVTRTVVWTENWRRRGWKTSITIECSQTGSFKTSIDYAQWLRAPLPPLCQRTDQAALQVGQSLLKVPGPSPTRYIIPLRDAHSDSEDDHRDVLR